MNILRPTSLSKVLAHDFQCDKRKVSTVIRGILVTFNTFLLSHWKPWNEMFDADVSLRTCFTEKHELTYSFVHNWFNYCLWMHISVNKMYLFWWQKCAFIHNKGTFKVWYKFIYIPQGFTSFSPSNLNSCYINNVACPTSHSITIIQSCIFYRLSTAFQPFDSWTCA